jgi:transposase
MRFQTILNFVERNKSFVYGSGKLTRTASDEKIVVAVRARKGSRPVCSGCGRKRGTYDQLEKRLFEYVPLWGIAVFFAYRMRRVNCPRCGVKVEQVPWCDGKNQLTTTYRWFLARWAKRLSWSEVAAIFPTSWNSVCRAVEHAVEWGLAHRDLSGVTAIGVDEVAWQKGHRYLTLVYDISGSVKRLLAIGEDRTEESLRKCLDDLGQPVLSGIKFVCSDMWRPYLNVLKERVGQALHILDRFHIMQLFGKALDEIRAGEARQLKAGGNDLLKHSRWCLLKRPENLTDKQTVKLLDLLKYNLQSIRAWILREDFQQFWYYVDPACAGKFLDEWCTRSMRSRLEPMKKIARTLRGHRELILNWFEAKGEMSSGAVEGMNNKVKLVTRRSYGFRHAHVAKLALFHNLGRLPEPEQTHRFC